MIEPKRIEIDGMSFQLVRLPAMKALRLDKKIVALLIPVISGIDNLDAEVDFAKLAGGVSEGLRALDDNDFMALVKDLLAYVTYLPEGGAPIDLNNEAAINTAFQSGLMPIYKLIIESMRYNKLSPFGFMEDGSLANIIPSSGAAGSATKKSTNKSARLGSLLPN